MKFSKARLFLGVLLILAVVVVHGCGSSKTTGTTMTVKAAAS